METRTMLYVEFPLARSLEEAIDWMKNGGSVWQECSDDFPNCGGFDTVEDFLENFPKEEFEDNCNFESTSIHLVPKDEDGIEAEPFKVGEEVLATRILTHDSVPDECIYNGFCQTITEIDSDGNIKLDNFFFKDVGWNPKDFCRCIFPPDVRKKRVYILADLTSSTIGYDFNGVYEDLALLKEECGDGVIWSDEHEELEKYLESLGILGEYAGSNWGIEGISSKNGELLFGVEEDFLRTK